MPLTNLNLIKNALVALTNNVYHYHAPANAKPPYIQWSEDGSNDFISNNVHTEFVMQGTIDLYTLSENDLLIESIPAALNVVPCAWYLNSVQYEEDTKLIHFEWVFEV